MFFNRIKSPFTVYIHVLGNLICIIFDLKEITHFNTCNFRQCGYILNMNSCILLTQCLDIDINSNGMWVFFYRILNQLRLFFFFFFYSIRATVSKLNKNQGVVTLSLQDLLHQENYNLLNFYLQVVIFITYYFFSK